MAYILPQVQVFQEFRQVPTEVIKNLNAFVFGPNYQLFRYSEAEEKALIGIGVYDPVTPATIAYPNQPGGSTVDLAYVKLYMDNVWAQYVAIAADAANPINVVSPSERNKLRAAPVIDDVTNANVVHANLDTATTKGWFIGGVTLPEYYYFYPTGGYDGSSGFDADAVRADISARDGRLVYVTSEDLTGTVDVPSGATTAGVFVPGPDGLQLDFDAGSGDSVLEAPLKVAANTGAALLELVAVKPSKMKDIIDDILDAGAPQPPKIVVAAGAAAASWNNTTHTLTLTFATGVTTVAALSAVIAAEYADVGKTFSDYCDITAQASTSTITTLDDALVNGATLGAGPTVMVRDCFRLRVAANPYIFATGNGSTHSSHFLSRGVRVGDMIRYSVTDDSSVVHTGTSRIVGFEADQSLAVIADPTFNSSNAADQTATSLAAGAAIVAAGADNQRDFDGANTKLFALDGVNQKYPGEYDQGLLSDNFIVTITTGGAAGTAEAMVTNVSGTYIRENVLIEATGTDDGQIYIGRNLYINFDKGGGDADAIFQVGDTYSLSADVDADWAAIDGTVLTSSGTYEGTKDTTYIIEVVRGGVFTRAVNVIDGLTVTGGTTLTASLPVTWLGGDNDDEYVLRCTVAGDIVTAQFALTSQRGDNRSGIIFGAAATPVTISDYGLIAEFSASVAFAVGDYWVIKVNASRPQVKIYDSAGVDEGSYVTVNYATDINLGVYGATLNFAANANTAGGFCANGGLLAGDVFYVEVTASAAGALRTLVLADDLPAAITSGYDAGGDTNPNPNNASIWLYLVKQGVNVESKRTQSPPDYNWEAAAANVTVYDGIEVLDSSWSTTAYLPVYKADMYLEYRALIPTYSNTIRLMEDIGDVETTLGTITPDNPLAQGVYNAISNSGNRGVYYIAVASDDLAGYLSVLDKATLSQDVYALVPLTQDAAIIAAVEAHINAQSTETEKRWRIAFISRAIRSTLAVYDLATNPVSEEYFCKVEDDPGVVGTQYTLLTFTKSDGTPSPYTQVLTDVAVGDKIRLNYSTDPWGDATYEEYTVASLVSNTVLKLASGPSAAISVPVKVEVWHPLTTQEIADDIAALSSSYANRRIYNCFPSQLGAFGVIQSGEFGAAAVAGLCSSVPPQQGLTNIELVGFDDLPLVYSTFSRSQLNKMAEYGTLIIMQDIAGGRIYIRHQLSTAAQAGNINTSELSVTKNLDSISYYFAGRLEPFIGRYNITPDLLVVLRTQINDGLLYLGSFTSVGLLGPQVLLDSTQIRSLQQHPTLKDTVIAIVDLQLPYPLNVIELHLVV